MLKPRGAIEACCRICLVQIASKKHSVSLFRNAKHRQSLAVRVRDLLDVPVDANDGVSPIVCEKCKRLEKSAMNW